MMTVVPRSPKQQQQLDRSPLAQLQGFDWSWLARADERSGSSWLVVTGDGVNRISPPFPPVSELSSGAGKDVLGGAVNGSHPGTLPPTAAVPLVGDAPGDSAIEGGAESEHTGTGFARNNTGPSAQHLDGWGSEGRLNLFGPFAYDLSQGQPGLGDWSCTDNVMDEYNLDFLAESAGEPPVSDAGIDSGPGYHAWLRRGSFAVGSSFSDNRTISRQLNGCDFFY